jgi:hypothetical protein
MMVFNGKRETRNGMELFTDLFHGSAQPFRIARPEAVNLNGISLKAVLL